MMDTLLTDAEIEKALNNVDSKVLGDVLKEYVAETIHNGWDGHSRRDCTGARNLLRDLVIYLKASR